MSKGPLDIRLLAKKFQNYRENVFKLPITASSNEIGAPSKLRLHRWPEVSRKGKFLILKFGASSKCCPCSSEIWTGFEMAWVPFLIPWSRGSQTFSVVHF